MTGRSGNGGDSAGTAARPWSGRFSKALDSALQDWAWQGPTDSGMALESLWGSMAHVIMLARQEVIGKAAADSILRVLHEFHEHHRTARWEIDPRDGDISVSVERRLIERLGLEIGGQMHTARSRNDQGPLDIRLHVRGQLLEIRNLLATVAGALTERAASEVDSVMVAYTHTQHAQPVSIGFWLSHYVSGLLRDLDRLEHAYDTVDRNPLGACALAGTSFPIDRHLTTELLGFRAVQHHGLDATSARDFVTELLCSLSILMTTVGRFAEEHVLWNSYEFRTVQLDDGSALGSSIMPQKKNPAVLELLRARAARFQGLTVAGLAIMKSLPSGYNHDTSQQKSVLWEALSTVRETLAVLPLVLDSIRYDKARMAELCLANFSTATQFANELVTAHGMPFRKAHDVVGSLVGELAAHGKTLADEAACAAALSRLGVVIPTGRIAVLADPRMAMRAQTSIGGTAPERVVEMLDAFRRDLAEYQRRIASDAERVARARAQCLSIAGQCGEGSGRAAGCGHELG